MSQNNITNSEYGIDFVTFEQAKKLKALGFNWETYACYDHGKFDNPFDKWGEATIDDHNSYGSNSISAPTLAQTQKWLREVKKEHIIVCLDRWVTNKPYRFDLYQEFGEELYGQCVVNDFQTYEEALSAGISAALKSIENG